MVAKTMPATAIQDETTIREAEHKKGEKEKKEHMQAAKSELRLTRLDGCEDHARNGHPGRNTN